MSTLFPETFFMDPSVGFFCQALSQDHRLFIPALSSSVICQHIRHILKPGILRPDPDQPLFICCRKSKQTVGALIGADIVAYLIRRRKRREHQGINPAQTQH